MRFTWTESKRRVNLAKQGLDFVHAEKVFAGPMVLFEDRRSDYGEQRMIGIGLLASLSCRLSTWEPMKPFASFPCAGQPTMKRTSSTKTPAISDDAPVLTAADFKRAKYRIAGKAATKAEWQAAVQEKVGKQRISIMLDAPIIAHFKAAAGERGYQTLINDALRRVVEGAGVVSEVRLAVREEMARYKIR